MSSRPPPFRVSDRPPAYRMVSRVYNNSLRPVVVVVGCLVAIWALIWAIPSFQDINDDKANGQPKFAVFDLAFGIIYITTCAIEIFGVLAAATQRLPLVRIYAMLSILTSILVVASGFMRVVLHFVYKSGLLSECESVAQGQGVEFRFGIWGPRVTDKLTQSEAVTFCQNAWNKDSLDEIIFLIFEILFSIFFTILAFAYYHQILDPTSAANVTRAPVGATSTYPDHYNRPYDAEGFVPPYGEPQPTYAPPPGPPPGANVGYGVGMDVADAKKDKDFGDRDNDSEVTKFDDPFADFDGPSKAGKAHDMGY